MKGRINPNLSVDIVIFGFDSSELKVLLIERGLPKGKVDPNIQSILALPGDLILDNENLDEAASRILFELTGLKDIYLEQCHAFGDPKRITQKKDIEWLKAIRADPFARVITIVYYSLVKIADYIPTPSHFAKKACWVSITSIPRLAFDHNKLLNTALGSLKSKSRLQPIGFELLPKKFTLSQLQKLYEAIFEIGLDKRNFRRKILSMQLLTLLEEKQTKVPHKPAQLYKFNTIKYRELKKKGFEFGI